MRILQIGEVFSHKAKLKEKDTNIFIKFHQILMNSVHLIMAAEKTGEDRCSLFKKRNRNVFNCC